MFNKINGLPAHIVLIHAVVILFPLAAAMLVTGAVWPAARRKLTWLTPALAFVVLALVPITTHAGEWLRRRLPDTESIEKHVRLGHDLLPWAVGIFLLATAVWLLDRRYDMAWRSPPAAGPTDVAESESSAPVWLTAVVAVLAIAVSTGGVVQLVRIGDSGANAVWGGTANLPVRSGSGGG